MKDEVNESKSTAPPNLTLPRQFRIHGYQLPSNQGVYWGWGVGKLASDGVYITWKDFWYSSFLTQRKLQIICSKPHSLLLNQPFLFRCDKGSLKGVLAGVSHHKKSLAMTIRYIRVSDKSFATHPIPLFSHLDLPSCDGGIPCWNGGRQKGASGWGFPPQKISCIDHSLYLDGC